MVKQTKIPQNNTSIGTFIKSCFMIKRIFLVGYMGSGKTTIGSELAEKLGFKFIDTDIYIEEKYQKTINEIFASVGEQKFREMETETLSEISDLENVVIATNQGEPLVGSNTYAGIAYMNITKRVTGLEVPPLEFPKTVTFWTRVSDLFKKKQEV